MATLRLCSLSFAHRGPYTLDIAGGECLGLQGPSGAGKTLLLRAIADLDPHEGTVMLDELACGDIPAPAWRKKVGLLPAESCWWHDRVGDHFGEIGPDDLARLQQLGFDRSVLGWQVRRLSTGEKQRLALVRLLQNRPEALLLDEPTANLYSSNVVQVERILLDYMRRFNAPVLWVSHDPGQLGRIATRSMYMHPDGRIEAMAENR